MTNSQNLQVKTKLSIRNIESNTLIADTSRSKINIYDKNCQSPIQEVSTQRSRTTTQNLININLNNAPNIIISGTNGNQNTELQPNFFQFYREDLISEGSYKVNMRRKSAEQHEDHINQYIRKYHNLKNVISNHQLQSQRKAEELQLIQLNQLKRNAQQTERQIQPNNLFRQRKSVLIAPEFNLLSSLNNKKEFKRLNSGSSYEIRPKRQTIPYSNAMQLKFILKIFYQHHFSIKKSQVQQIDLEELKLEKNDSSRQSSINDDLKFQKTQTDLSKIYAINQYKETKKKNGKLSLVDNLLNQYATNQLNSSISHSTMQSSFLKKENFQNHFKTQSHTRRPSSKQVNNLSQDRMKNHSSELCQEKGQNSELMMNKRLDTDPSSNDERKEIPFKNNGYYSQQNKQSSNNLNILRQIVSNQNRSESLKQFASRHINQSFLNFKNPDKVRNILISPEKATFGEINTFSKFFSQKSPLLTPQKQIEKYLPPINLQVKSKQNSSNLSDSQSISKNNSLYKYAIYLSQKKNSQKKMYYPQLSRDASCNGSTSNQSYIEIIKLNTEPSPQTKKYNGLMRKIF